MPVGSSSTSRLHTHTHTRARQNTQRLSEPVFLPPQLELWLYVTANASVH